MKRKLILALAAASTLSVGGAFAQALVTVQVAPPAPIVEAVPAPREGFTWSPGHWEFRGGNHVWVGGHWVENRDGFAWVAPHWQQRPDGTWMLAGGAFMPHSQAVAVASGRDRDRDGTPDHLDDDKDNDGVPNRYDSHPNNRWRD